VEVAQDSAGTRGRPGCLVSNTTLELLPNHREAARRIRQHFRQLEALIAACLAAARDSGQTRTGLRVDTAARLIVTVMQGFRVLGKASLDEESAIAVAELLIDGLS